MYSKLLVPIDGSEPSKLALAEAIKLAHALRASIRLLHVVDLRSLLLAEVSGANCEALFDTMRHDGERLLREAADTVHRAGIQVDTTVMETPDIQVGECVVRTAHEQLADLIICGTHGRRGMRRLLMGSDAEYIVRHAPVPVLLLRSPHGL